MPGAGYLYTLTSAQYGCATIQFTGSMTQNNTFTFPNLPGAVWIIDTTGVTFNGHTMHINNSYGSWGTVISAVGMWRITCGSNGQIWGEALTS